MGSLNVGGAETMIVNIFRHIDRDRFDFSFLVNGSRGGYYEKAVQQLGGSVDYLPKRRQSLPDHYCELYRIIKRGRYHVIHFHTQNAFLTSTQLIAARLAGANALQYTRIIPGTGENNRCCLFISYADIICTDIQI